MNKQVILPLVSCVWLVSLWACSGANQPDLAATLDAAVTRTIAARRTQQSNPATPTQPDFASQTPNPPTSAVESAVPSQTATLLPTLFLTPTQANLPSPTPEGVRVRPNGEVFGVPYWAQAPTVDGNLGEWGNWAGTINLNVFGANNWQGLNDCAGLYAIGWNEQALYLAVQVTDDVFSQPSSGVSLWQGDSVELQWDGDLGGDFDSASMSEDDRQFGFSTGSTASNAEGWLWLPKSQSGVPAGVVVKSAATGTGYQMEIAIPWAVLGGQPQANQTFGYALNLSDNDQPGAAQESMVSMVVTRKWGNPTTWGTLQLK
jgi:hypothetical protein